MSLLCKRFEHQGTVDNNLGPDRLTGLNTLDPNHIAGQTTH